MTPLLSNCLCFFVTYLHLQAQFFTLENSVAALFIYLLTSDSLVDTAFLAPGTWVDSINIC